MKKRIYGFMGAILLMMLTICGCSSDIVDAHINDEIAVSGDVAYFAGLDADVREETCLEKHIEFSGIVSDGKYTISKVGDKSKDGYYISTIFDDDSEQAAGVETGDYIVAHGVCTYVFDDYMAVYGCKVTSVTKAEEDEEIERSMEIATDVDESAQDGIAAPISNLDCEGKNYAGIEKMFKDAGFTNVVLYPSEIDAKDSLRADGEVVTVWAGDKTFFDEGESLVKDAEIGIGYVILVADDENENKNTDTVTSTTQTTEKKEEKTSTTTSTIETEKEETKVTYTYKDLSATKYAKSTVNVRALPDTSGDKLGSLVKGDMVTVTGQCNETGWYRFEYNGKTGYASNDYLLDTPPATETQTTTTTATTPSTNSTRSTSSDNSNSVTVPDVAQQGANMVWIPTNGGTKYHSKSSCSKMKDPMQVTKEQAEANGFTPCGKCY